MAYYRKRYSRRYKTYKKGRNNKTSYFTAPSVFIPKELRGRKAEVKVKRIAFVTNAFETWIKKNQLPYLAKLATKAN